MKFTKKGEGSFLLDVTGYVCPHPQIYTKKALSKMNSGDILEIIFDNPSSDESISSMCDIRGEEIIEKTKNNGLFTCTVRKA